MAANGSLRVTNSDPYFNKSKWNSVVDSSVSNSNISNMSVGNKFKGIYDPNKIYNFGDFVAIDDKFYIIEDIYTQDLTIFGVASSSFYTSTKSGKFSIKNGDLYKNDSLFRQGSYGQNYVTIAYRTNDDSIYCVCDNHKLYKINIFDPTYKEELIIGSYDLDETFSICLDDFYVYCKLINGRIYKIAKADSSSTEFTSVNFGGIGNIIKSITCDDRELHVITDTGYMFNLDKELLNLTMPLKLDYIVNANNSIIESIDNNNLVIYGGFGSNSLHYYYRNSSTGLYNEISNLQNSFFEGNVNSIRSSQGEVLVTNQNGFVRLKYPNCLFREADTDNIFITNNNYFEKDYIFGIDLSKGNVTSHGVSHSIKPTGYADKNVITSDGLLQTSDAESSLKVQFYPNKGALLINGYRLAYTMPFDLHTTTVFYEFTLDGNDGSVINLGNYSNNSGKMVNFQIQGEAFIGKRLYKVFFSLANINTDDYRVTMNCYSETGTQIIYKHNVYDQIALKGEANLMNVNSINKNCYYNKVLIFNEQFSNEQCNKYSTGLFNVHNTSEDAVVPYNELKLNGLGIVPTGNIKIADNISLGVVKGGGNINIESSGELNVKVGTNSSIGGVKNGGTVSIVQNGMMNVNVANDFILGGVKGGGNISISPDGTLNAKPASYSSIGGMKGGFGHRVDQDGSIHVQSSTDGISVGPNSITLQTIDDTWTSSSSRPISSRAAILLNSDKLKKTGDNVTGAISFPNNLLVINGYTIAVV